MPCRDGRLGQPPDLGLPLGGGQATPGFRWLPAKGFWGKATGYRNSRPGLPRPEPTARPSCSSRPPCRRVLIPIRSRSRRADRWHEDQGRADGRGARDRQVSNASNARRSSTTRMPFPDCLGETLRHGEMGRADPVCPGVKPEAVKIEGKVNVQLCDAKGCVQPKDYPFSAALRPDVQWWPLRRHRPQGNARSARPGVASAEVPPASPSRRPAWPRQPRRDHGSPGTAVEPSAAERQARAVTSGWRDRLAAVHQCR